MKNPSDSKYRLGVQSKTLHDFKGQGPRAVASECNEDATRGSRPLKLHRVFDCTSSMFRFAHAGDIQTDARCYELHSEVRRSSTPQYVLARCRSFQELWL